MALPSLDHDTGRAAPPAGVSIRGWGWRYSGRRAWACRGVDLHVAPGERVLVVGPSGGGKSTLLHGVAGLLDPETAAGREGSVLVDGRPATQSRHRIGMLFQDPESSLVMARAGDDVAFGLENAGVPREQIWPRVDAALEHVGFPYRRDRSTAALSGGEQQRLALAGALVRGPGLLVLDEPTANLDPDGTRLVLAAVEHTLDATGATLLVVEHHVRAALPLVDRVVVLEPGGGIADDGRPEEVFGRRGSSLAARGVWVPAPWGPPPPTPRRSATTGAARVVADGVSLRYPGAIRPALAPTDLVLQEAEAVAVTGPNGSGKSTLAMLLAGLVRPSGGEVRLVDAPDLALHRWRARDLCRRVGTVFQDPEHQLLASRVDDELTVGPRRTGVPEAAIRRRSTELLDRLHLGHLAAANPFTLSGGEKRRLSVATALATSPEVLVLDEPTFGQDARTWAELVDLCADLRDAGTSVLAVTHDEAFAAALADRRVEVRDGVAA
ncbi:MAG TPA: ATP-binding cassette domain-containing protein [Jiangellales bacterium]|nr:ATP-binding cassette domain-containing protein [Jiangellales bacterium]